MTDSPGEFDLIARCFAPLAGTRRVDALGLGDDAARFVPTPGLELVLTSDALVAGVHFLPDDPPALIARKALRVNLSDLAAKGARPVAYLLCLALPADLGGDWVAAFAGGLAADQMEFGIELAGGDTTSTPGPLTIAITAIGEIEPGRMLRRDAARAGDDVWVSGTIGDAALGLGVLRDGAGAATDGAAAQALVARYRLPQPRLALGGALAGSGAACMDVSDGLVQDLGHIARRCGCGAVIDEPAVPLSAAAADMVARDSRAFDVAVSGGDDYELLFALPPAARDIVQAASAAAKTPVARIGRLVPGSGVDLRAADGQLRRLARGGWTHF
jgi:thiamine-monophosphate kinase